LELAVSGNKFFLESIKLSQGRYHNLDLHWRRIVKTFRDFFGRRPSFSLEEALPDPPPSAGLHKTRLVYGSELISAETEPYRFRRINSLKAVAAEDLDYGYKFLDRERLSRTRENSQADEIIIVQGGLVTDCSIANLVFEGHEGLVTPDRCLLQGVKRQRLLDSGVIKAKEIKISDVLSYRRVRLINAMIDLEDNIGLSTDQIIIEPALRLSSFSFPASLKRLSF
jgi:4-amino-4-deoxychorismate lyase